ncbi:hypothetical protein EHP00_623 [Ecytonucleospora hepatopenaei]|uniref:Uncharacterized protein n=1 Tax=Ecytonucleospora hepatopenaei TaxID=646526 RepID=A0A1W0E2M1_9MICR|nr:hypothetical protein EHP00_623 [Ecytonucleospora hepatopenaei]
MYFMFIIYFSIFLQKPLNLSSFNNIFSTEKRKEILEKIVFLDFYYCENIKDSNNIMANIEASFEKEKEFLLYEPIPRIKGMLLNFKNGMDMKLKVYEDCYQKIKNFTDILLVNINKDTYFDKTASLDEKEKFIKCFNEENIFILNNFKKYRVEFLNKEHSFYINKARELSEYNIQRINEAKSKNQLDKLKISPSVLKIKNQRDIDNEIKGLQSSKFKELLTKEVTQKDSISKKKSKKQKLSKTTIAIISTLSVLVFIFLVTIIYYSFFYKKIADVK